MPNALFSWGEALATVQRPQPTQEELNALCKALSEESEEHGSALDRIKGDVDKLRRVVRELLTERLQVGIPQGEKAKLEVRANYVGDAIVQGPTVDSGCQEFNFPPGEDPAFRMKIFLNKIGIVAHIMLAVHRPQP